MRTLILLGFGLTIVSSLAACSPAEERTVVALQPGIGGTGGSGGDETTGGSGGDETTGGAGGQGGAAGSGGQGAVPYIDPAWIKIVPDFYVSDVAADATNHLVAVAISLDENASFDAFPAALNQIVVVKMDPSGNVVWLRSIAGPRYPQAIAMGPDGRVIVLTETWKFNTGIEISPVVRFDRFYLTTFDANGELLWEQSFGGDISKSIRCDVAQGDVVIDDQGNAIVAGSFTGRLETPLGAFQTKTNTSKDMAFVKIDPDGSIVAAKHFDAPESEYLYDIAIDGANHTIAVVTANGSHSIMKLDAAFSVVWKKGVSGDALVYPSRVAIGADDDILVAGLFEGTVDLGLGPVQTWKQRAPFFVQWDAAGNHENSKAYVESESLGVFLAAKSSGEFVFTADFTGTIDLGGGTISNAETSSDCALGRYLANGTYTSGTAVSGHGWQDTSAMALTPQGPTYWATYYLDSLKYGDKVLVEPLPDNSQDTKRPRGTALFALPP